jgi:putative AlgH/UPF0301 family transcriptional regulator
VTFYSAGPVGWFNQRAAASSVPIGRAVSDDDVRSVRLAADGRQVLLDSVRQVGRHAAQTGGRQEVRIFCGYNRWEWVQLLGEFARGDWGVCPASLDDVFTAQPKALWAQKRNGRPVAYPPFFQRMHTTAGEPQP